MAVNYDDPIWLSPTTITSPGLGLFNIKETLKAAGYVTQASGDGVATFDIAGVDVITHGGSGAGGYNNNGAWWWGSYLGRHFMIYLLSNTIGSTSGTSQARILYSKGDGFDASGASATLTPAPLADGRHVLGGGTAAAPTGSHFFQWFSTGSLTSMTQLGGVDRTTGCFWFSALAPDDTTLALNAFMMEETVGETDDDPVVVYCSAGAGTTNYNASAMNNTGAEGTTSTVMAWFQGQADPDDWSDCAANSPTPATPSSGPTVSAVTAKQYALSVLFGNTSTPAAFKGYGKHIVWIFASLTSGLVRRRTYTLETANDRIRIGQMALPWDGTLPDIEASSGTSPFSNGGDLLVLESLLPSAGGGGGSSSPRILFQGDL